MVCSKAVNGIAQRRGVQGQAQAMLDSLRQKHAAYTAWLKRASCLPTSLRVCPKVGMLRRQMRNWHRIAVGRRPCCRWTRSPPCPRPQAGLSRTCWVSNSSWLCVSPTFNVTHPIVALRLRGKSAQSTVMVDNYFMIEFHGLLFGDLRKPIDHRTIGAG